MTGTWLRGLLTRRPLRVWGTAAGVALTTAFLALLLAFIATGRANMTARAAASVAVDWQVLLGPQGSVAVAEQAIRAATPVKTLLPVGYADVAALSAVTGPAGQSTTQTTGAGKVLGVPPGYAAAFPAELRALVGATQGALLSSRPPPTCMPGSATASRSRATARRRWP